MWRNRRGAKRRSCSTNNTVLTNADNTTSQRCLDIQKSADENNLRKQTKGTVDWADGNSTSGSESTRIGLGSIYHGIRKNSVSRPEVRSGARCVVFPSQLIASLLVANAALVADLGELQQSHRGAHQVRRVGYDRHPHHL